MSEEGSKAKWNFLYEKGLIDILIEHKVDARFKGQNGWNSDGWKSVTSRFNEKFPLARFTKQPLQDKEKDLKASFRAINGAKKDIGIGWNEAMGMIVAKEDQYLRCEKKYPKIKMHRKNGFPLFRSCEALYEGSIATGDLSFKSTELTEPVQNPFSAFEPLQLTLETQQNVPSASEPRRERSEANVANPFSTSVDGHETSEAQSAPSGTSTQEETGKKRKQSQVAAVLDDYLEHKKKQTDKTVVALLEKRRLEEECSIERYLDTVDAMKELTDEEKAIAAEVFENDINRQMFMKQKNLNVCLIWLWRKLKYVHVHLSDG